MANPTLNDLLRHHQRLTRKGLSPEQAQAPHTAAAHAAVNLAPASTSGAGTYSGQNTDPHGMSAREKRRSVNRKYGEGADLYRAARAIWARRHGIDANVSTWSPHQIERAHELGLFTSDPRSRGDDTIARLLGNSHWPPDIRHNTTGAQQSPGNYGGAPQGAPNQQMQQLGTPTPPKPAISAIEQALASASYGPQMGRQSQYVTLPNDAVTRQIGGRRRRRPSY